MKESRCGRCLKVTNLWEPIGLCCDCFKAYIIWWTEIRLGPVEGGASIGD